MGKIDSDAVNNGKNNDLGTWKDNRYVRCSRCGFPCHLDRDTKEPKGSRSGWGITNTIVSGLTATVYDPLVTGGCPQCGTYLYNKEV
jgi:hypothetical protein